MSILDMLADASRDVLPEGLQKRSQRLSDDMSALAQGDINPLQMGVRGVGEAVGGFGDLAMDAAGSALSAVTPDFIEEPVSEIVRKGMEHVIRGAMDTGAAKVAMKWAEENPEQARDLAMAINAAELGMMGAGSAARTYGSKATKGGMLSTANNKIDNYYGQTDPDKIGPVTQALEAPLQKAAQAVEGKLPGPLGGMARKAAQEPLSAVAAGMGIGRTTAGGIKDAVGHALSPRSRAMYGEEAIASHTQKRMQGLLDDFAATGKPDGQFPTTNMSREAHAQSLYSNLHIPDQMGREGPRLPEVDMMATKQFVSEPRPYEKGAIAEELTKFKLTKDDMRGFRPKKLGTKAKGWEQGTRVGITKGDAEFVEKYLTNGPYAGGIDELRVKAPAGIETGGHYGDVLVNRNQAMPYITNAFKKTRSDSGVTDIGKLFDELEKGAKKSKEAASKDVKKKGFTVINRDKAHAEKNGLWVVGSATGSGITEGGIGWMMKIKPNGELTAFMFDKHDFMGPVGEALTKKKLVAITPPMMGNIDQLRKTGFVPASHFKQVPTRQIEKGSKELIEGLANAKPSARNVAAESVRQAGGIGLLTDYESNN